MDLSSLHNKGKIVEAMNAALAPPSEEEQQKAQMLEDMRLQATIAEAQGALLINQKTMAETRKILNEAQVAARRADVEDDKVRQEQARIAIQIQELAQFEQQNDIALKRLALQEKQVDARIAQMNSGNNSNG